MIAGTFTGVVRSPPYLSRWTAAAEGVAGLILLPVAVHFVIAA